MKSGDYVPFIILSDARTGSTMLAQALNSSPHITCFREVFNFLHDFIQSDVEGYDNFSETDLLLRRRDPVRFLDERIFGHYPEGVRAVGLKFHYGQFWGTWLRSSGSPVSTFMVASCSLPAGPRIRRRGARARRAKQT